MRERGRLFFPLGIEGDGRVESPGLEGGMEVAESLKCSLRPGEDGMTSGKGGVSILLWI